MKILTIADNFVNYISSGEQNTPHRFTQNNFSQFFVVHMSTLTYIFMIKWPNTS